MSIFTYAHRVNKILKDEKKTAVFTPREITFASVNLAQAARNLTFGEYCAVSEIFHIHGQLKEKRRMNRTAFLTMRSMILAQFDLIAPVCKFCGDPSKTVSLRKEKEKEEYRKRAEDILADGGLFQEEWMALCQEFWEKFHKIP